MMDYVIGNFMMMQLGSFQFGLLTAAYQELQRSTEYRWVGHEVFGKEPVLQYVGKGADTITLPGVIFPEYRGGLYQIDNMRAAAGRGKPHLMISGFGVVMGSWVIERVEETHTTFAAGGIPRKIDFTLNLRKFAESN